MTKHYVQVSTENPRYFELSDGAPFIPIGPNLSFPRSAREPASELDNGRPPETLSGERLDVRALGLPGVHDASFYDPWTDTAGSLPLTDSQLVLPDFKRSLVLRVNHSEDTETN